MIISISWTETGVLSSIDTPCSFSFSVFLLFLLFIEFILPPGEEGSSALETLCVGLTVGSLGCSGCFDDYWGHLDQLQGCFSILQGLAQVQDLGRIKEKEKNIKIKSLPSQTSEIEVPDTFSWQQTVLWYVLSNYSN